MIKVNNLTYEIFGTSLFEDVSFMVHRGDKVGLVGPNGSGKTTVLKIILGELEPDNGSVKIEHERIGYLSQATIEDSHGSIEEFLGNIDSKKIKRVLEQVSLEKIDLKRDIRRLSGGQKTRVAFAKALLKKPTFLLLDEPTNNLDLEGLIWFEGFIRDFRGGVIIVSHDRRLLDNTVTKILEIDGANHTFTEFIGGYTDYILRKEQLLERQEDDYKRQQRKERRMKLWITQKREEAKIYDDPSKGRQIRAMEKRLQREIYDNKIEKPQDANALKGMNLGGKVHTGKLMLRVDGIRKHFDSKSVLKGVSFELRGKDRVLLSGANGSGKTTLLKIIMNELEPDAGSVMIGENIEVGYFAQEHEVLDREKTVLEEFRSTRRLLQPNKDPRKLLGAFLFGDHNVFKKVGSLSFGERVRLTFAKLTQQKNELLILDEPTNHLDIQSREAIEDALAEFQGAVLVVSHDRYFIDRISIGREVVLKQGVVKEKYRGEYETGGLLEDE